MWYVVEKSISGSVTGQVAEGEATAFYYTYNNLNQLIGAENDKGMTASYDLAEGTARP